MPASDSHSAAVASYQKRCTKQICLRFYPSDMDLYDWLRNRGEPTATFLKTLAREAMMESKKQSIPTKLAAGTSQSNTEGSAPSAGHNQKKGGCPMPAMQFEFLLREEKEFLESLIEKELPCDAYVQAVGRLDIISRSLGEGPAIEC